MALHLEFVVPGPPVSNQQRSKGGKRLLTAWRVDVLNGVRAVWSNPKLATDLRVTVVNVYGGPEPTVDVDNMLKPIFDVMQQDVYDDDRQIRQVHAVHLAVGAEVELQNASPLILRGLQTGGPFVYVRVEDLVSPYPLPG